MGTPVLSLPSAMMQSRVAAGYAANAGCPQPASINSLRAYESTAVDVASRPHVATKMRRCLTESRWTAAAFDTQRWVDAFDEGARMVWEHHRYGMRAMHVLLPARHVPGV